jgi:hypothetical protein
MPRILISNIDNESMMADERALTPEFCRSSSITAGRMAWFAEPGDIVVLPRDLSPQLKVYIARTMGYEPGSVTYLTPDWGSGHPRPIRARTVAARPQRMARLIGDPPTGRSIPIATSAAPSSSPSVRPRRRARRAPIRRKARELLNDKRVFGASPPAAVSRSPRRGARAVAAQDASRR